MGLLSRFFSWWEASQKKGLIVFLSDPRSGARSLPAFVGNAGRSRETALLHARSWPYGFKTQEYFAEIRRMIAQREELLARYEEAADKLRRDIRFLERSLPKRRRGAA